MQLRKIIVCDVCKTMILDKEVAKIREEYEHPIMYDDPDTYSEDFEVHKKCIKNAKHILESGEIFISRKVKIVNIEASFWDKV